MIVAFVHYEDATIHCTTVSEEIKDLIPGMTLTGAARMAEGLKNAFDTGRCRGRAPILSMDERPRGVFDYIEFEKE